MQSEVETVLGHPDYVELSVKDRINTFKYLEGRYIRVTSRAEDGSSLVVTVAVRKRPFEKVQP